MGDDLTGLGWQVRFEHEWTRPGWTMHLWRRVDNELEIATGTLTATRIPPGTAHDAPSGIYLPDDAYDAIVKAIDPPAHAAELRRIEDALAVERGRVDRILDFTFGGPT